MGIEVRRLRNDSEFVQYLEAANYAFNGAPDESNIQRYRDIVDPGWCLGAFDDGGLVAGLTIVPFEQYLLGETIPLGGIASVASLPERRREGAVGELLRCALHEMREAGQVLSGLYTPHYSLYRRFGWEIAHRMVAYSFPPKQVRTRVPRPTGSFMRLGADDWPRLAKLREPFVSNQNGALVRTEGRWRKQVFSQDGKGAHDAVIWTNAAGEPRGYLVYRQDRRQTRDPWGEMVLRVVDWLALDGDAYSALLNYLLSHDLVDEIVLVVSEDEPLLMAFEEPVHMKLPNRDWPGMLTRIVDVPGAFAARPTLMSGEASVVVGVGDRSAPWNQGVWRVTCKGGALSAEATDASPQLECDVSTLGPLFNGFLSVESAARVGRIQVHDAKAAASLAAMLTVSSRPFCPDDF